MHQFGSKSMIHVMQHVLEQSPDFDVFSADAVKAFYNLNRDLASIKFEEKCPVFFNMFIGKYDNSSNAFFFFNALAPGVLTFHQTEGGSCGAVEMNFFYELEISDFVNNVAQLLRPSDSLVKKGSSLRICR